MPKSLREMLLYACLLPVVVGGAMWLAGAGVFALLTALLIHIVAGKIVSTRKSKAAALHPNQVTPDLKMNCSSREVLIARTTMIAGFLAGIVVSATLGVDIPSGGLIGFVATICILFFFLIRDRVSKSRSIEVQP